MTIDFIRGMSSGLLLAMAAVAAIWYVIDRNRGRHARPLAERIVDWLFWFAIRVSALAQAADRGLLRYRQVREELVAGPKPEYSEAS